MGGGGLLHAEYIQWPYPLRHGCVVRV